MRYKIIKIFNKINNFLSTCNFESMFLYRPKYKLKKLRWTIHLNDVDTFPSYPHMHSLEDNRFKMNVYTGEIIDINSKEVVKILKDREMYLLWNDNKFLSIVNEYRVNVINNEIINVKTLPELPKCISDRNRKIMNELKAEEIYEFESTIQVTQNNL